MKTKRTDPHRPGAIIPADYDCFGFFAYGGAYEPPFGMEVFTSPAVQAGGMVKIDREGGGCQVCGANYRFGVLFKHTPTGQFIKMGHECARKYEILADFASFDAAFEAHKRANAAVIQAAKNKHDFERYLDKNEGLREALACGHRITNDLADKLRQYRSLSPAQIALAFRLQSQQLCPARAVEANVPAPPEGRQKIRGVVISTKTYEGDFGVSIKMTVKVSTPAGTWLCWGTKPATVEGHDFNEGPLKGREIEFTATLKHGREAHFALFSRPTNAKCVDAAPELEVRPGLAGVVCAQMNAGER